MNAAMRKLVGPGFKNAVYSRAIKNVREAQETHPQANVWTCIRLTSCATEELRARGLPYSHEVVQAIVEEYASYYRPANGNHVWLSFFPLAERQEIRLEMLRAVRYRKTAQRKQIAARIAANWEGRAA